jgi:uncharacterized integral membrane protein
MEPIMIVFLGVIVGGMIVAMYLPIFDMINAVGHSHDAKQKAARPSAFT